MRPVLDIPGETRSVSAREGVRSLENSILPHQRTLAESIE